MDQYSHKGAGTQTLGKAGSTSSRFAVVLTAAVAALGGAIFGYDTSVISGAMLFLRRDFKLTDVQWRERWWVRQWQAIPRIVGAGAWCC